MTPRFFSIDDEKGIRCTLCPHRCRLSAQAAEGRCRVRRLRQPSFLDGKQYALELPYYGYLTALAHDPIEKKPLYHWRPGSSIVSVGFAGCNLHCPFCQNWHISQIAQEKPPAGSFLPPEKIIADNAQIAYTYSEPLVHAEYLIDCMDKARSAGAVNVLVTTGCINAEAAEEILSRTDAANIDLKSFSEKTYSSVFGGNLPAVLDFIRLAVTLGVHTEITTLVVPGLNDSNEELMSIAEFIAGLAATNKTVISIPWHVSAYHPDWKWKTHFGKAHPPTEPTALFAIAERARAILSYVYTGNIAGEHNDTFCSYCGAALAIRRNYRVNTEGLSLLPDGKQQEEKPLYYRCAACGTASPVRWT